MFTSNAMLSFLILGLPILSSCLESDQFVITPNNVVTASTIRDTLRETGIIDEVLDDFEPLYYIDLSYPKKHEQVLLGNDIPVKAVQKRPVFTFHELEAPTQTPHNSTFTLILTDPDAKSRDDPKWSEMCHWILTNLTATLPEPEEPPFLDLSRKAGELEPYLPPGPPPKTGRHRYVFVLLKGDSKEVAAPKERRHWGYGEVRHGVRDWANENNLTVVGANFFYAQNKEQ